MNTHTNERGQIVYENEQGDIGVARPQEPSHHEKHGIIHSLKEGAHELLEGLIEGPSMIADALSSDKNQIRQISNREEGFIQQQKTCVETVKQSCEGNQWNEVHHQQHRDVF